MTDRPATGRRVTRKAFVCVHCEGVYADQPVSQCDCMAGTGADFVVGTIRYTLPATSAGAEADNTTPEDPD